MALVSTSDIYRLKSNHSNSIEYNSSSNKPEMSRTPAPPLWNDSPHQRPQPSVRCAALIYSAGGNPYKSLPAKL